LLPSFYRWFSYPFSLLREEWARELYDPCKQDYKYYDKGTYCGIALKPFSLRIDDER
jgi:hypothetical protein